jgi:hypothetical protein
MHDGGRTGSDSDHSRVPTLHRLALAAQPGRWAFHRFVPTRRYHCGQISSRRELPFGTYPTGSFTQSSTLCLFNNYRLPTSMRILRSRLLNLLTSIRLLTIETDSLYGSPSDEHFILIWPIRFKYVVNWTNAGRQSVKSSETYLGSAK